MTMSEDRRTFLRLVGGLITIAGGAPLVGCSGQPLASASVSAQAAAASTASAASTAATPSSIGAVSAADAPTVNFALNLQYLAAQFYTHASTNAGLPASALTGVGAQGASTNGLQLLAPAPAPARYASEIATDKTSRLAEVRTALSSAAVGQPAMELSASVAPATAGDSQTTVAAMVGAATNAFSSDRAFLLAALLFEDVSGAAFRGALTQVTSAAGQTVLTDLLADSTYHAGLLRSTLVAEGASEASLTNLSTIRRSLDGVTPPDADAATDGQDIVTSNGYVAAFTRTPAQALNVLYLTPSAASAGGFFPQGLNGAIRLAA